MRRFKRPGSEAIEVITGPILIYRNPCLHQGDIRVVMAVDKSELDIYVNVVVLSIAQNGSSIASMCSGGDLDGDMFSLIWDHRLVPPLSAIYPSLDYEALAKNAAKATTTISSLSDEDHHDDMNYLLADFYTKVISNDILGRVAHLHLALCDYLPIGSLDPLALELAKSQSLAVDFPKTGILPTVPIQAVELVHE